MKRTLVLGSTCVDVVIRLDHLPKTEENLHPESQSFRVGGCAYNVANILRQSASPYRFVTPVGGQGIYGAFIREHLDRMGFNDYVYLPDKQNGCCYCFVEKNGERTFVSVHGAEYAFNSAWMYKYEYEKFDYVYVCGLEVNEPTGGEIVKYLEGRPAKQLFYAPSPHGAQIPAELTSRLFELSPILHLNEHEALELSKTDTISTAANALYMRTGAPVIITEGADGVYWRDIEGAHSLPATKATVADTIGAGDAHAGATLVGLSRGLSLGDALAFANRVASAVVATDGATLTDADARALLAE